MIGRRYIRINQAARRLMELEGVYLNMQLMTYFTQM